MHVFGDGDLTRIIDGLGTHQLLLGKQLGQIDDLTVTPQDRMKERGVTREV